MTNTSLEMQLLGMDRNYGWGGVADLPVQWKEMVDILRAKVSPVAALLYGSRLPGWPEPPLERSDYDIIMVVPEGRRRKYRGPIPGRGDGPTVDLTVTTIRGIRSSQLLSPEYHVMERHGLKMGDWSWHELGVPLSWLAADNTRESLEAEVEAGRSWRDDGPDYAAKWAVMIIRGALLLRHAINDIENLPGWDDVAQRYGLPRGIVLAARGAAGWPQENTARQWGGQALKAARKAVAEAKSAVAAYPRNASDAEFRARRDAELAQRSDVSHAHVGGGVGHAQP